MKIGIMGGTFDPVHIGHLMIAEEAYKQYNLDTIWFLPNGNPPHKQGQKKRTDVKQRVEMIRLAIKDKPYFQLNLYEAEKMTVSFSYETMETFAKMYPDDQFFFIIGADSLFAIETWAKPERLFKTCKILAAYRDDKDTPEEMLKQIQYINKKYNSDIDLLKTGLINVSSSYIRESIKNKVDISKYLPVNVLEFIEKERLYGC